MGIASERGNASTRMGHHTLLINIIPDDDDEGPMDHVSLSYQVCLLSLNHSLYHHSSIIIRTLPTLNTTLPTATQYLSMITTPHIAITTSHVLPHFSHHIMLKCVDYHIITHYHTIILHSSHHILKRCGLIYLHSFVLASPSFNISEDGTTFLKVHLSFNLLLFISSYSL